VEQKKIDGKLKIKFLRRTFYDNFSTLAQAFYISLHFYALKVEIEDSHSIKVKQRRQIVHRPIRSTLKKAGEVHYSMGFHVV
jgi:hypothetical protein